MPCLGIQAKVLRSPSWSLASRLRIVWVSDSFEAFQVLSHLGGERLKVLQKMLAHTQFCWPGDNTIEDSLVYGPCVLGRPRTWPSTTSLGAFFQHLACEVVNAMATEHQDPEDPHQGRGFVVVVSDANFRCDW